jgi:hypothetical protein
MKSNCYGKKDQYDIFQKFLEIINECEIIVNTLELCETGGQLKTVAMSMNNDLKNKGFGLAPTYRVRFSPVKSGSFRLDAMFIDWNDKDYKKISKFGISKIQLIKEWDNNARRFSA